jgi:hypothetical protein
MMQQFRHEAVIFRKNSLYLVISTEKTDVYGNNLPAGRAPMAYCKVKSPVQDTLNDIPYY